METGVIVGTENTGAGQKPEKGDRAIDMVRRETYIYTRNQYKTISQRKKQKEIFNIFNAVAFVKS